MHWSRFLKCHSRDKEYDICSYNKSIKRAQTPKNQALKICGVCIEVGNYIDIIILELEIQPLETKVQILTRNQLQDKIKENHMKRKMEINHLEGMIED